ncbi:uncharacterized protein LOC126655333 [Mercurialis annua]|uniref:uncharacterized protein LOC126655333 n=1 Tax=Mercurialis annua TaxID=3986 RepID=UPI00215E1F30|nr:uncharacterized protein LOC126655333 [Mercurialis annua]XP_050205421.1 uncharacterized protein LOC126655333 [Mercurialis annua]
MSRCFPFPPPGYEKKARVDDTDLLKKEKHKEKKHGKDKKDNEKREGKEKRDKDRSKDKHREKKDRKEKHKDKDRDKDKDKNHSSEEKKFEGQSGYYNGEKCGSVNLQNRETGDSVHVEELARRIRNEDRASGSQMFPKVVATDKRRVDVREMVVEGDQRKGLVLERDQRKGEVRGMLVERDQGKGEVRGMVVEREQEKGDVRGMVMERDQGKWEVRGMVVERSINNHFQEKEKASSKNLVAAERIVSNHSQEKDSLKNKTTLVVGRSFSNFEEHRKVNGQRNHVNATGLEKPFGQNSFGMDQERVEGIVKLVEKKDAEKQMEGKVKNGQKEYDSKGDKHKTKDREKSRKSKHKDRSKEEKKEKTKEIKEPSKEQPILKENSSKLKESRKDPLDFRNNISPGALKLSSVSPAAEAILGKRKEPERNGHLLDAEIRPSKFPRPASSSPLVVENGKKLEMCQTAVRFVSEKQGLGNSHGVDIKEQKINGFIKPQQKINGLITAGQKINGLIAERSHISSTKSSAVGVPAGENGEAVPKPPHPDMKYLSRILSIPKMEECLDVDDQEWLLSCNHPRSTIPSRGSPGIDGAQQVWAETLRIESADISALPYVIPY